MAEPAAPEFPAPKSNFLSVAAIVAGALALSGLAATTAKASPIVSFGDVLERAAQYRNYSTSNLTVNNIPATQKLVLWGYKDRDIGGGNTIRTLVMGLDNDYPDAPNEAYGWGNADDAFTWGLLPGEVPDGFIGGIDGGINGLGVRDGNVGDYNPVTHQITFDAGEGLSPSQIQATGIDPFSLSGPLYIDSINITPEPATGAFLALGLAASLIAKKARKYFSK